MADTHLLDHEIRTLLVRDLTDQYVDDAMAFARVRLAAELEASPPRRSRRRAALPRAVPMRAVFALGAAALALLVAVALDPVVHHDASDGSGLAREASAAETLRLAGSVLEANADHGAGDVLRSTQTTHRGDVTTERTETWIDTRSTKFRIVRVVRDRVAGRSRVSIDSFDGDVERQRDFVEASAGVWALAPNAQAQLNIPGGAAPHAPPFAGSESRPDTAAAAIGSTGAIALTDEQLAARNRASRRFLAGGPRGRASVNMTRQAALGRWLVAAGAAQDNGELLAATSAFMASTRGSFFGEGHDATPDAIRATSVRQLLYLAEHAPIDPDALRFLYGRVARLGDLRRLSDVVIDGRPMARIQFDGVSRSALDPASYPGPAERDAILRDIQAGPSVAALDMESGLIVRLESVDRSLTLELGEPEFVAQVGDHAATCGSGSQFGIPCDLVDGIGPLALLADEVARQPFNAATGVSMATGASTLGGDAPLRPHPDQRRSLPWSPDLPKGAL